MQICPSRAAIKRKLRSTKPTTNTEKTKLQDQRNNLYKRIVAFNKKATSFIPDTELSLQYQAKSKSEIGGVANELDEDYEDVPLEAAEAITLLLPSSVKGVSVKYNTLAGKELDLRKAQVQDALQGLRIAIAYKSLLLRKKVRGADSVREKDQAWASVDIEEGKVSRLVPFNQCIKLVAH